MRVRVLIAAHMALLVVTSGVVVKDKKIWLDKCCDVHQMLSADAESCVEANWPSNFSIKQGNYKNVVPPLDKEWVRRWLPPGLPMENIVNVLYDTKYHRVLPSVVSVNASIWWDPSLLEEEELLRNTVVLHGSYIVRPRQGGRHREATYCMDAAPPPLGPFVIRFRTICIMEECTYECCYGGSIMINNEGHWKCEDNAEGFWRPGNSSLTVFDPEFPYLEYFTNRLTYLFCEKPRLVPFEERYADWSRHTHGFQDFYFSSWHTCFDFYRSSNDSLQEGLFICEHSRITRGVYWLLRPLCFLSALLLTASLLSVACNKDMRRKIHGRCLACHAASLFVFNIGQIVYYIALSERFDEGGKTIIPPDLQSVCKYFSLSMYFVLTASWFWLSALCVNMMRGFRLHLARPNEGRGKKFLAISAFAWGLPAVLTLTCSVLFTQPKYDETPPWYTPSFIETRTCYIEPLSRHAVTYTKVPFTKSGTALFYYGPVFCLVLSNIVCLVMTLRKVQYLKRGNSVLRREEDQIPLGQRHTDRNNPPTAYTATGNEQTPQGRNRRGTTVDAKTIKLYIKMALLSGGIELLTEVIMWLTTRENIYLFLNDERDHYTKDRDLAYRAAGYVTDFFRAAVVTWLAAPEGGYLHLMKGMLHRDRQKKSPGAGNAGRRKHNVA